MCPDVIPDVTPDITPTLVPHVICQCSASFDTHRTPTRLIRVNPELPIGLTSKPKLTLSFILDDARPASTSVVVRHRKTSPLIRVVRASTKCTYGYERKARGKEKPDEETPTMPREHPRSRHSRRHPLRPHRHHRTCFPARPKALRPPRLPPLSSSPPYATPSPSPSPASRSS